MDIKIDINLKLSEIVSNVPGYLFLKAIQGFVTSIHASSNKPIEDKQYESVSSLRDSLATLKLNKKKCYNAEVSGMFYPGVLLAPGWWERKKNKESDLRLEFSGKREGVGQWLLHGFEQWAPSWESTLRPIESSDNCLLGQLGSNDEANSILVVACEKQARDIRGAFLGGKQLVMAKPAKVMGELRHIDDLSKDTKAMIDDRLPAGWEGAFDYCLHVQGSEKKHHIKPVKADSSIYSGYLWECLYPKDELKTGVLARVDQAYFLWEHTNFSNEDAILFGIEALQKKREILEKNVGSLVMLQRSAWMVEEIIKERPFYDANVFTGLVQKLSAGKEK